SLAQAGRPPSKRQSPLAQRPPRGMAAGRPRGGRGCCAKRTARRSATLALAAAAACVPWARPAPSDGPGQAFAAQAFRAAWPPSKTAASAALAQLVDPRQWGAAPASFVERLSGREWLRMYRTLGISDDASREQVLKATARLRKKYADDETALQRVETANLWIMTRFADIKEEDMRKRQQANRLREFGNSPKRLFQTYVLGYLPPGVRQMFEAPTGAHARRVSVLLGGFALLGLCVPASSMNFVGLAAASALGFIYTRARPEPVKDEFGNAGSVQKINPKEMVATIVLVILGGLLSAGVTFPVSLSAPEVSPALIFCETACVVYWMMSLSFKVYQCFDD
ncbi:unnamed protein product, partial [Prorocentrum cordatum]